MLKINPIVNRDRLIIAIGSNYDARKILFFIVIENECITKALISYLLLTLTHLIILPLPLFITPLSCLSSFDLVMRMKLITSQVYLI